MTWHPRRSRLMRQPRVPEKMVQAQIVDLLRKVGAEVYVLGTVRPKGDTPGTRQSKGLPDVYAFLPPRHVTCWVTLWVEVKSEGGKLRPEQETFRELCLWASHHYIVGGLEDVTLYLQRFGWLKAA